MDYASEKGFTLIELMITVAIIGILASVAIPRFNRYVLKSRSVEAGINLKSIATAEIAYMAEYGAYRVCPDNPSAGVPGTLRGNWDNGTTFEDIGFAPKDSEVYYQYRVGVGSTGSLNSSFDGLATGNLDGDGNNAVYQVTQDASAHQTDATFGYY